MQAYIERLNKVEAAYRNICAKYRLEVPKSTEILPKVGENGKAKIPWALQIQTDKLVMIKRSNIITVGKLDVDG